MRMTGLFAAAAIMFMAAAPALAAENPAAKLSLTDSKAQAGSSTKLAGKSNASKLVIPGLVAAGVVIAAVAMSDPGSQPASS
jgi:hypothetical protein